MEKEEKINIALAEGQREVIIVHRQDGGVKYVPPVKSTITGDINSAKNYLAGEGVLEMVDKKNAVVRFNHNSGIVTLDVDPQNSLATTVSGQLKPNADLAKLTINGAKEYSLVEMRSNLKFAGPLFADRTVFDAIMKQLDNTRIKIEHEDVNIDNRKGESEKGSSSLAQIPALLKEPFYLQTPFYEGQPETKFQVEFIFNAEGRKVTCWLESVEMKDLQDADMKRIMDEQKQNFDGFVKIDQY